MKENFQPGTHPDADQLSIFAEGAANAHERERMMTHLAECAECRSVVFLMQGPAEPEPAMAGAAREWPWRRWLVPAGLAAAALACGLATIAYVRAHRQGPETAGQDAQLQRPQPLKKDAGEAAKNAGGTTATGKPQNERATRTPGLTADKPIAVGRPKSDERQGLAQASDAGQINNPQAQNLSGPARALSSGAVGTQTAQLAPAPQPALAPPAAVGGERTEPMGLRNRNFAALSSRPFLRIEHNQGPDDGTSRVSGRVTDITGAVVPGARVTLRDAAGKTRQTTSSGDGSFDLAQVPPGHYDLGVVARGFEGYKQTMDLKPRDMAMLDASLTVGAEAQTVEVTAAAPSVETSSASVVSMQVAELPSRMPAQMTVAVGKRLLSLDADGALFLSRNRGRSWKKVKPQWPGKVDRIEASDSSAAQIKRKTASEEKSTLAFQLTTDSGAVWLSEDGMHWRQP